jgi:hypothetical protein
VAEWLKAPDSKSGLPERVAGVRIPSSPPFFPIQTQLRQDSTDGLWAVRAPNDPTAIFLLFFLLFLLLSLLLLLSETERQVSGSYRFLKQINILVDSVGNTFPVDTAFRAKSRFIRCKTYAWRITYFRSFRTNMWYDSMGHKLAQSRDS